MAVNRGKKFEDVIKQAFEQVPGVSIDRLHDQTTGYRGSSNICDFIVYREPYEFYFECKSVHGNTLSISSIPKADKNGILRGYHGNITDTQWDGLIEKSKIKGVYAGIICWWVDRGVTMFLPIQLLRTMYECGEKSVRFDFTGALYRRHPYLMEGKKKRVFYDYNLEKLLNDITGGRYEHI